MSDYTTPCLVSRRHQDRLLGNKMIRVRGFPLVDGWLDVRVYVINANGTNLRRLAPRV